MAAENSLTTLLRLTDAFLSGNGFQKTASQLQKEAKKRGIPLADEKPEATLPSLDSVFSHWQANHSLNETEGSASDDEKSSVLSESDDSSDESSDSDSDSSSDSEKEEEVKPDTQRGTKRKRGKTAASVSASSSASSSSDSSDSDSSSSASSSSESSSDSASDSDSDSDSEAESVKKAVVVTAKVVKATASSSDSDSSSSDSGSDSSDSESDDEPQETALTTPQVISRGNSTASTSTLIGTSVPAASSKKRKLSNDDEAVETPSASDSGPARKLKKTNEPFSRISKDQYVDPRLASNQFVPYDYAQRAHEKLIITKGKGFTKEKNKGKRGSYRGGKIDFSVKGIKFDD